QTQTQASATQNIQYLRQVNISGNVKTSVTMSLSVEISIDMSNMSMLLMLELKNLFNKLYTNILRRVVRQEMIEKDYVGQDVLIEKFDCNSIVFSG
ncbi:12351_t:CDS:2, partial [Funneliformis mosseae]